MNIKEAYGEHYEKVKHLIDKNTGWCTGYPTLNEDTYDDWLHDHMEMDYISYYYKDFQLEETLYCRPSKLRDLGRLPTDLKNSSDLEWSY